MKVRLGSLVKSKMIPSENSVLSENGGKTGWILSKGAGPDSRVKRSHGIHFYVII